ncbi:MAG: cyclohexanecarboxyl-CoA dehydrogenase [Rhizobiales bacterium NRL2]|jgi:cyclohexanecarboxyl-CoA dehydrogenase|nr:MAG: cyclohexanecarboxyl-CoA dehydrogenase [Rhizobiales bacterium NRL2]
MEFGFTEEQRAFRDTARRFAADRLQPRYQAREAEGGFEDGLLEEMGALGLLGADLPMEYGGSGIDGVTSGMLIEQIGWGDLSVSYAPLLTSLLGDIVASHGSEAMKNACVPRLTSGQDLIALGLTEPRGGSDAANLVTKAERTNAGYVLNGEKTSISCAAQAKWIIAVARTGTPEDGARGVTAFLVPMDAPGVSTSTFDDVGSVAVGRGSVFFDDVRVGDEHRLGAEGAGFREVMAGFDYSRALIGLQVIGCAKASLEETWEWVQQRTAFGHPIAKYQGVTEPLAVAETKLRAAELLCYQTLWLRDQGLKHTAEAAMCKWFAPQTAFETVHQCILLHGHMGYAKDTPHQQRLRDIMGLQIGDGTAQIQKMIIAREKIGKIAVPYA